LINFIRVESKKLNQNFSILQVDNQWIGENKLNRKSIPKEIVKSFESSIMQKDFTKEEWM